MAEGDRVARQVAGLDVPLDADIFMRTLVRELANVLRDIVAADQASLLEREILPQATRSLELARLLYEEGETSLLDLLDAQRTFREAQRERLESHLAQAFAVADVQRLAGPDFDPWR